MKLKLALALLVVGLAAAAEAETLEQAKAFSGVKFGETAGIPSLTAGAVNGSRSGAKARAALATAGKTSKKTVVPPSPSRFEQSHRVGSSVGFMVGAAATMFVLMNIPLLLGAWGVIGAAESAYVSYRRGARGKQLAKAALGGAAAGVSTLLNAGSGLGALIAHAGKKLFHKE